MYKENFFKKVLFMCYDVYQKLYDIFNYLIYIVLEILWRSFEMDIIENDEFSGDVILWNVMENDGDVFEEF